MSREERIRDLITIKLNPTFLSIENETAKHSVPIDSESHFRVVAVSTEFNNLKRVHRHQLVNELLKDEFANGLHALSLLLYGVDEWESKKDNLLHSPDCKGGSRHG